MNLATTIWAECQIPNPKQIPMSKFEILDVLSMGISCLDYFIFRLFQALILFGPVLSLPKEFRARAFRVSDECFIRSYAEDYFSPPGGFLPSQNP